MRKSQRQNYETKVRKSIKSLTNALFENKMSKDLKQEHFIRDWGLLCKTFNTY